MAYLNVNIDHIATLRQARRETVPDPVEAAALVERAGAHGITVHLREDRRHIQDHDVKRLRRKVCTMLNLEMAATDEMARIALSIRPDQVTLVPEKRRELTTEGGLAVVPAPARLGRVIARIQGRGIPVSLFITPDPASIRGAASLGARMIEIHTGSYSRHFTRPARRGTELRKIRNGARLAKSLGLQVHAGHGLTYGNVGPLARMPEIQDLNIGHNIVARASMVGLERAVREMLAAIR